jgi:preprotein translocase subunit SecG
MLLFAIIVLTILMVLDCVVLTFLVLMQLPKKEAGAGLAFGGAATDALFGAGSGNFLTKATKYAGVLFFALAILLSVMQSHRAHEPGSDFLERVKEQQNQQPTLSAPPTPPSTSQPASGATTNTLLLSPAPANAQSNVLIMPVTSNAAPATSVPQK